MLIRKLKYACLISLLGFTLLSCKQNNTSSSNTNNYKENVSYTFFDDTSCKADDKTVCMNYEEYKAICSVTNGVTKFSLQTLAVFKSYEDKILLKGGNVEDITVGWEKAFVGGEKCFARIQVSGLVDGNSMRKEIQGVGIIFVKNEKGEILISNWD
jgi:hypothetical protein